MYSHSEWIAFSQSHRIASGMPSVLVPIVKSFVDENPTANLLIFDIHSSRSIELDLRASVAEILEALPVSVAAEPLAEPEAVAPRAPGRPKLGVTPREVTLLPRHWEWLASQPGGTSVTLRTMVELSMRSSKAADQQRVAQDSAYRFMTTMAGDEPGYEDAIRALFASNTATFQRLIAEWPEDVREHAERLASLAMTGQPG